MPLLEIMLAVAGIGCFGAASAYAYVCLTRQHPPERNGGGVQLLLLLGCAPLLAMLVLHGMNASRIPMFNSFNVLTAYGICLTFAAIFVLARRGKHGVLAILAPYVTVVLIAGLPYVGMRTGPVVAQDVPHTILLIHLLIAFASYALFSLASIIAIAYLIQDRNFKNRNFGVVFERLPPLETLDHMMFRLVGIAFLLLTVSLVMGVYLVHQSGNGRAWMTDPKILSTLATWILYAGLVHMRANAGRHGTRLAVITLIGLAFVLFSMFGVHLIANSLHSVVLLGGAQ